MELLSEKIPKINIKDVVVFTHNTDNLQKYIEYLMQANKILLQEVSDLKIRTVRLEEEQKKLPDISFRLSVNEKKTSDIYESINSFKLKFMDIDKKNTQFEETGKEVEKLNDNAKVLNEKTETMEKNIVNLNKLTENNIKAIERESENIRITKEKFNKETVKILDLENKFASFNQKIDDKYREFDSKFDKISVKFLQHHDEFTDMNERILQINSLLVYQNTSQRNLNEIIYNNNNSNLPENYLNENETDLNKAKELKSKGENEENADQFLNSKGLNTNKPNNKNSNSNNNNNHDENNKNSKANTKENEFVLAKDLVILKTNIEMNFNKMKNEIKDLNKDLTAKINELFSIYTEKLNKESNENSEIKETESNNEEAKNNVFSMPSLKGEESYSPKNSHKNFMNHANALYSNTKKTKGDPTAIDMEELNLSNSNTEKRIKDLETKLNELEQYNKQLINEQKKINEASVNEKDMNKSLITNIQELLISEEFEDFINLKVDLKLKNFANNLTALNEIKEENTKNTEEINKIYESIVALRNIVNETCNKDLIVASTFDHTLINLEEKLKAKIEHLDKRFNDDTRLLHKLNGYIQDSTNELIEFKGLEETGHKMKDYFNMFIKNIKYLLDKTEKNTMKLDNLSGEIINKLKKDLWGETVKAFDEFKQDLKKTIVKIDDQLREKVDINNFQEYDKKLDQKISNEFNKKLDKKELKRNNNLINKKIDTLENKISKTLVDTLIDLQLEEAPLILKKGGMGLDKCGSCNQILQKDSNNSYNNFISNSNHMKSTSPDPNLLSKFQLKNIQDTSAKLGFASYSRFISHLDSEEDLNSITKQKLTYNSINSNSINLPDIVLRGNMTNSTIGNSPLNMNQTKLMNTVSPLTVTNTYQSTDFSNLQKKNLSFLENLNPKAIVKPRDFMKVIDKYHSDMALTQSNEFVNTTPNIK